MTHKLRASVAILNHAANQFAQLLTFLYLKTLKIIPHLLEIITPAPRIGITIIKMGFKFFLLNRYKARQVLEGNI